MGMKSFKLVSHGVT